MMPTFFVAGVPKAGTSSLYNYLRQHPQIFMSTKKEPHFFSWEDEGWPRWAVTERRAYEDLFAPARPDQERGEASSWTLYSEGAAHRIAHAIADPRFIILLRNPTDRAYSNWAFNYGKGFDTIDSFEAALAAEPERIAGGAPWHHHYVRAGLYYPQLKRYFDCFDRRQLLVLVFEDLKADADRVVRRAYEFLGVEPSFEADTRSAHNATYVPRSRRLHDFSWRSSPVKTALKKCLPRRLSAHVGRRLKAYNKRPPRTINPDTRRRLNRRFREDVSKLSELVGRDFHAAWFNS